MRAAPDDRPGRPPPYPRCATVVYRWSLPFPCHGPARAGKNRPETRELLPPRDQVGPCPETAKDAVQNFETASAIPFQGENCRLQKRGFKMARLSTICGGTPGKPGERGIAPQPPQPPQPPRIPEIPKIPKASPPVERKKKEEDGRSRRQAR